MPYPTDDLVPLLVPTTVSAGQLYGEGKLVAWNQDTLENEVEFRGTVVRNLRVAASGFDALTWQPGDLVELRGYAPRRGSAVWWIGNRIITPGAGAADVLLASMQTELAKAISAQVFADRIQVETVADEDSTTSLTFVSLSPPGPAVSDVEVVSGVALAFVSSRMDTIIGAGPAVSGGYVGIEVSGATAIAPVEIESALDSIGNSSGDTGLSHILRMTALIPFTGLNPGTHTFTLRYRSTSTINDVFFSARSLAIVAL